jgi:hypothetical protein
MILTTRSGSPDDQFNPQVFVRRMRIFSQYPQLKMGGELENN